MTSSVDQLKTEFAKTPDLERQLFNPPASEADISEFKAAVQKWGLPDDLPETFYEFYRWHNGSKLEHGYCASLDDGLVVLSLTGIISEKEMWDDLELKDTFYQYEPGTWWNKTWVPVWYIPDWYIQGIDTSGCFGGAPGQVLGFDFTSAEGKWIAHRSFDQWLETILELKRTGLLSYQCSDVLMDTVQVDDPERDAIVNRINGDYAFSVEIWPYRRKDKPENIYWKDLEQALSNQDTVTVQSLIREEKIALNEQNLYILEKFTPLLLALHLESFASALWLIEQGADLTLKDCYGFNTLGKIMHDRYRGNHTANYIKLIQKIMDRGYQPTTQILDDQHLLTPLADRAVGYGDIAMVDFCFSMGVDINSTIYRYSPRSFLHDLASNLKHFAMADYLVAKGIDKSLTNSDGKTALAVFEEKFSQYRSLINQYDNWIRLLTP